MSTLTDCMIPSIFIIIIMTFWIYPMIDNFTYKHPEKMTCQDLKNNIVNDTAWSDRWNQRLTEQFIVRCLNK